MKRNAWEDSLVVIVDETVLMVVVGEGVAELELDKFTLLLLVLLETGVEEATAEVDEAAARKKVSIHQYMAG